MKENFLTLRKKFNEIKEMGYITPLRKGTTGIGYTFETLLGKKEDYEVLPDFKGIEIKTKFGYSKSKITLFNCIPMRNENSAINYIIDNYSWNPKDKDYKVFSNEVNSDTYHKKYSYNFELKINYLNKRVVMNAYKDNVLIEEVCYWDFQTLEKKLKTKLNYLAIVIGYPYKKNNNLYYKYLKMTTYKLKDFYAFVKLIETKKIQICFYIKRYADNRIENHGIAFKIDKKYIENLFEKLNY